MCISNLGRKKHYGCSDNGIGEKAPTSTSCFFIVFALSVRGRKKKRFGGVLHRPSLYLLVIIHCCCRWWCCVGLFNGEWVKGRVCVLGRLSDGFFLHNVDVRSLLNFTYLHTYIYIHIYMVYIHTHTYSLAYTHAHQCIKIYTNLHKRYVFLKITFYSCYYSWEYSASVFSVLFCRIDFCEHVRFWSAFRTEFVAWPCYGLYHFDKVVYLR